jgi:tetratricopeptide (TPR) repeat protein
MIVAIPNRIRDRAFYEYRSNPESYARIQMWEAALAEIGDHPFGIGLGLYQYTYPQYAFPIEERMFRYGKTAQTPHSEFLQMAIELSVASVACMGLGVLTLFRTTHQILRSRVRRSTRSVVAGSTAGTVVILTQAAVDSNLHEPGVTILLVLFVAIILALHRLLQRQVKRDFVIQLHGRGLWVTIGMLLICVLGWQVVRLAAAHAAYESGSDFMRRGAFESAVEQYRQAVNLDAGKALYHSALAGAYLAMYDRHGNAAAAQRTIDEFQTALDLNPLDGRLAGLLADAYARFAGSLRVPTPDASIQRRQWIIKAIELSERASRQEPMSFRYPFQRAHYHLQLKETERSLMMIRRTLEIEPNFLPARELLIHLYLDTGAIEAARSEYEQIILRRLRYASWDRDVREEQFLQINLDKIRSEFKRKGVSLP